MPIPTPGDAPSTDLVSIDDVASHLNWSDGQKAKYTDEMARFISATTAIVEDISGPVVQRQFDQWYSGGRAMIQLDNYPVVEIIAVTESYGSTVLWTLTEQPLDGSGSDAYGYTIDYASGMLVRRASGIAMDFASGVKNVHVTYTAGMCTNTASVPPNVALAALELIRINWQPQQGGNRPQMGQQDLQVTDAMHLGFFIPNRVMEILKPNANRFGIA